MVAIAVQGQVDKPLGYNKKVESMQHYGLN
jgi:hypothetical protein